MPAEKAAIVKKAEEVEGKARVAAEQLETLSAQAQRETEEVWKHASPTCSLASCCRALCCAQRSCSQLGAVGVAGRDASKAPGAAAGQQA
jgi:hypothetical protein